MCIIELNTPHNRVCSIAQTQLIIICVINRFNKYAHFYKADFFFPTLHEKHVKVLNSFLKPHDQIIAFVNICENKILLMIQTKMYQ